MVRVLGIDPALASIGYAVLDGQTQFTDGVTTLVGDPSVVDYGIVSTDSKAVIGDRLSVILESIELIATKYKPDIVAVEKAVFSGKNTNAAVVQYAVGVIFLALRNAGYTDLLFFAPIAIKKQLLGTTKFESAEHAKRAMKAFAIDLFNLEHNGKKDDQYDALAIAYMGLTQPEKSYAQQSYSPKKKKAKAPRKTKAQKRQEELEYIHNLELFNLPDTAA